MFSGCGFNVFAGRSFLGLGTLLTGAKVLQLDFLQNFPKSRCFCICPNS